MMQLEQRRGSFVLELAGSLGLGQLDETVRVAGVADPAVERELETFAFADGLEARVDHGDALGAAA